AVLSPKITDNGINAAGILNTSAGKPFFLTKHAPTATDAGDFECYRNVSYTSGTQGFVNPCIYSYTNVQAGQKQSFEWSLLARLDNYANASGVDTPENVAAYFQGRKYGTAPTWGAVTELYDQTPNPVAGSVTDEHDMSAKGADTNGARVILDMFARNPWDSTATTVAWGIRLNTDANTTIGNGITFNGAYGNGLNFSPATINQAAIILGDTHAICFDTACLRKKFFSSGVTYQSVPTLGNVFSWSDAGQFSATTLNTGGDILFSGTSSAYPMLRRNGQSVDVKLADNSGYANLTAANLVAPSGGQLCLDGLTCANKLSQSSGTLSIATSGGTINAGTNAITAGSITGSTVTSSGNIVVPTNGKVCLNGSACTIYITYDGTEVKFMNASGPFMKSNATTGALTFYSAGGLIEDVTPGASCPSGINAATFQSVKGMVTHC
ncbi:MAG TPA: hypothetical protein VJQ45_11770, partial [Ktedonobacterales bacterium]|nr:hypothetical protein [Ktedonobacterales bacterium]